MEKNGDLKSPLTVRFMEKVDTITLPEWLHNRHSLADIDSQCKTAASLSVFSRQSSGVMIQYEYLNFYDN